MQCRAWIDTGPLVAALNRHEQNHSWAREIFGRMSGPYLTSEGNFAEACHLLERRTLKGSLAMYDVVETGLVQVASLRDCLPEVQIQVARYKDREVDFADACLLVLAARFPRLPVITTDRTDFTVYLREQQQRLVLP